MRVNALLAALPVAAVVMGIGGATAAADATPNDAVSPASHTVTVQEGDYLAKIAETSNTTYVRLYDANTNITNPDLIYPGESIRIPPPDEQLPDRPLPVPASAVTVSEPPVASAAVALQDEAVTTPVGSGGVWDRLARCESSGNWATDTGNGYYGGLQFDNATWQSNGGRAYAPRADLASRNQQIAIASKVEAARGWSPWPACSAKLGL